MKKAIILFFLVALCAVFALAAVHSVSAEEYPDSDGDGIPDCIDIDSDGDGIPDMVEFVVGTDPLDAESVSYIESLEVIVQEMLGNFTGTIK